MFDPLIGSVLNSRSERPVSPVVGILVSGLLPVSVTTATINSKKMENPTKQRKFNVRRLHKLQRSEGGSNQHCCVPLCSASSRYNGSLSFHRFPKNPILRAQWIQKIRRTGFEVTNHTKVCSRHFDNKLITSTGKGLRVLLPNSVPSLFNWNNFIARQTRAGVWERRERPASPEPCSDPEEPELPVPMVLDHEYSATSTVCVDREHYSAIQKETF